jgi:saccharopine dehydrogenase-like NADP-dependent oxidoreductase
VEEAVVDIHNHEQMVEVLRDVDLVFNTVGPYFAHGTAVADAALASNTHYADVCADVEITRALLAKDQAWQDAGLTAVTGFGASPGLTNLLASKLAGQLDEIREISMFWWDTLGGDDLELEDMKGTLEGFVNEEFGPVPTFEGGREITVNGFHDGAEELDVLGHKLTFFHAGHSEQITVPLYFPVEQAHLKGCVLPNGVTQLIDQAGQLGMRSDKKIDVFGTEVSIRDFLIAYAFNKDTYASQCDLETLNAPAGMYARATGLQGGTEVTVGEGLLVGERCGEGDAMSFTGVAAAVCAEKIVDGRIDRRGVYAPEALDAGLAAELIEECSQQFTAEGRGKVTPFA